MRQTRSGPRARRGKPSAARRGPVGVALLSALALAGAVLGSPAAQADDPDLDPLEPIFGKSDHYIPKAPGTKERINFYYGPYVIPPGWDANRVDLDLPLANGFVTSIEPGIRRVEDGSEPSHQEAHIHHAHWFSLNPGSETDNYTYGLTDWMFGNGDEETKADFDQRSAADPNGPIYGSHIGPHEPQPMIYMLHNKTQQPMVVHLMLEITFTHGTMAQLNQLSDRPYHDVTGVLFGRTFDVPRNPRSADKTFETAEDDPRGVIEWTSPIDGTIVGTGSHLHPGGLNVVVENYGSEQRPCPDDGRGYGGTRLLKSDALFRKGVRFSEDFQMEVTNPAFRAPIRKGDRIRISGTYENKRHGWYDVMTHEGIYIDEKQKPRGSGCKPYLIGKAKRKSLSKREKRTVKRKCRAQRMGSARKSRKCRRRLARRMRRVDPAEGVPNRSWGHHPTDTFCGRRYGEPPCDKPVRPRKPGAFSGLVTIANFQYRPGDLALSGPEGRAPRVRQGDSLTFLNVDQALNIRHSVTTCRWPCNGPYVANYPLPDGHWDSETLGYDLVDGGEPSPLAETPPDLEPGKYAYFCRIHPWMRGAFEVTKR